MKERQTTRARASLTWVAQVVPALIMGQTLFFKFSGAPEAVALFETLGAEPWGRIGVGILELIAAVLLLLPRTAALGGTLGVALMSGALFSHFTKLGIEVEGDGGALFVMAVVTLITSATVVFLRRCELPVVGARFCNAAA